MSKNNEILKDKQTTTEQIMSDIIRQDLSTEIDEFSEHVQNKIERLDDKMKFVNYKFSDVRFWFRRYSISIIYLATFLTLVEALMNSFNIEEIDNTSLRNSVKFSPLLLSSLVSLIAAIIKFNKYEEKIEDITRATEKGIITIAKLKEVKEELYFCKTVEHFIKINDRFTRDIYTEYLESSTNIERQLLDTDYAKYMKRIAHNDVKRAKIMIKRNVELDQLGELELGKIVTNPLSNIRKSVFKSSGKNDETESEDSDYKVADLKKSTNGFKQITIKSSGSSSNSRSIPYRGISPPPCRPTTISNKKMTPHKCMKCSRSYLLDVNDREQKCPHCKTIQNDNEIEFIINNSKFKRDKSLSPKSKIEEYANHIQRIWRGHKERNNK